MFFTEDIERQPPLPPEIWFLIFKQTMWTKLLAIFGFVLMGLMVIVFSVTLITKGNNAGLEGAAQTGYLVGTVIGAIIVLAGIYFYPTYALLMYSNKIKKAFNAANQEQFESAINYLKNTFKYISILMIISLVLYGIAIIFLALAAVKSAM